MCVISGGRCCIGMCVAYCELTLSVSVMIDLGRESANKASFSLLLPSSLGLLVKRSWRRSSQSNDRKLSLSVAHSLSFFLHTSCSKADLSPPSCSVISTNNSVLSTRTALEVVSKLASTHWSKSRGLQLVTVVCTNSMSSVPLKEQLQRGLLSS